MINYRAVKAINNSLMSVYEDEYGTFVSHWVYGQKIPNKSDESLTMGSLVDVLLTRPEAFKEEFIIFKGEVPTAQMLKFCDKMAELYKTSEAPDEVLGRQAFDAVGVKGFKFETVMTKYDAFKPYVNFLLKSEGKDVISSEQEEKAKRIVRELKVNQYTAPYVNAVEDKTHEVHNQLEIYVDYKKDGITLPLKGALDRVLVSHEKRVIQPIDFKTSFNVLQFDKSYYKYRYYRQASYYRYLVSRWAEERGIGDYEILPFIFVVCSTSGGQHWLFRQSTKDTADAQSGGENKYGEWIKGWEEILTEIVYLTKSGEWAFPYEAQINNGIIELNIFK